ncbi:MAG: SDR family NAD(P)-dependent oxidoreductase [Burkholderiales bacterium]
MDHGMAGKSALITGAFSGLGLHFANTLAQHGAKVVLAGRRLALGQAIAKELTQQGHTAAAVSMDVLDGASVMAAVAKAAQEMGGLDILVNNAGVANTKPFLQMEEADWNGVVDVNLTGAWRVAQAAAKYMAASGKGGSIINIASIAGLRVAGAVSPYAASKAGLIHLTKAMALELARHKIRVNALAPGYIETDLNREFFQSEAGQALIKRIPQRRLGKLEHLDGPLLLLASDASEFMTGSVIAVDGGHLVSSL